MLKKIAETKINIDLTRDHTLTRFILFLSRSETDIPFLMSASNLMSFEYNREGIENAIPKQINPPKI